MDKMPLINLVLQSFPESVLLLLFGTSLFKRQPDRFRLLAGAIISALCAYLIRRLPFPYGVHSLIGVVVLTLIFKFLLAMSFYQSMVASLTTLATLGAIEILLLPLETSSLGLERFSEAWPRPSLRIFMAVPELAILALITYRIYRNNICGHEHRGD
ncbi:hypothetical protein [Neomoorella thermoacetica]|uniref:hypothetical protein n=1 Tax=Neomoorella thermoacetica TaxID=1525 RepID=UPI0008FAF968|nr:hypothetical protein [Moorella thermoacetica]APC08819.1 hypothetical protein MTJW_16600 [Moorella thermoacetica]